MKISIPPTNDDGSISFRAGMTIDADGANGHDGSGRAAYGPSGTNPLDYLANAGHAGNWWGIATDADGEPYIQKDYDLAPGYYISTTSYQHSGKEKRDPNRYLDSAVDRFIVVPSHWRTEISGVVLGCAAKVYDPKTGRTCDAIVGDFGPTTHLGEASMAVAAALGFNSNPKSGTAGCDRQLVYTIYPGIPGFGYELKPMNS